VHAIVPSIQPVIAAIVRNGSKPAGINCSVSPAGIQRVRERHFFGVAGVPATKRFASFAPDRAESIMATPVPGEFRRKSPRGHFDRDRVVGQFSSMVRWWVEFSSAGSKVLPPSLYARDRIV